MSCEILFDVLEKGSIRVEILAFDAADPPNQILRTDLKTPQWQLMRDNGYIINNRSFENASYDDPTLLIFYLKANDLVTFEDEDENRLIRNVEFQAKYDTTESGQPVLDIDLVGKFSFEIIRRDGAIQEIILNVVGISQSQIIDNIELVL